MAYPDKEKFILIFDQFEELFTYPEKEIDLLKKELSELLYISVPQQLRNLLKDKLLLDPAYLTKEEKDLLFSPLNVKILFSIRSDKLSLLNKLTDYFPSVFKLCYELKPLNTQQARLAIEEPATLDDKEYRSQPFTFTNEAIALLLNSLTAAKTKKDDSIGDFKQEIETFQLQIICKYAENLVIEKNLNQIAASDLGNIKEIFENHYRNIIARLSPEKQLPARRLIEEKLIIDGMRVSMPVPFILRDQGMTRELLDELISTHILRPAQNNTIEISHDTLIEPILKYYDERNKQEAIESELQEKEEQIKRIRSEQKIKAKRNRLIITIVSIALVLTIGLAIYAIIQSKEAIAQKEANATQLARTYWDNSQNARTENHILEAVHFMAEGVITGKDTTLTANMLLDIEAFLPQFLLKNIMKHEGAVYSVVFSPDGKRILTASADSTARIWDAASGKQIGPEMKHPAAVVSAVFSPDGNSALTVSEDSTARLWDVASGKQTGQAMKHGANVISAVFSPDGKQVLTASFDSTARLWNAATGKQTGPAMRHEGNVVSAVFSPDGKRILTANDGFSARLWDPGSGKQIGHEMYHQNSVYSAVFSPDGKRVLTASGDKTARIWDAASGKPLTPGMTHQDAVLSAVFSPDGKRVLTASYDRTARLWDAASGKQIGPEMKHAYTVVSAVFSPDGKRILTASKDKTARIWDALTGKQIGPEMKHEGPVNSAVFSPDGKRILTASDDFNARLWDVVPGKQTGPQMKHEGIVLSAVFSPDGKSVLTASSDETARLWNAASGKQIGPGMKHKGAVNDAIFSPDGKQVLTASDDSTSRLWDAASGKQLSPG